MANWVDFTAYLAPVMAVPCDTCKQPVGSRCKRPSEHTASDFHKVRKVLADAVFIAQHGEDASIERTEDGWLINPTGRAARNAEEKRVKGE